VPHDEDEIRRLLADARHTEPLPDDVAARLDAVLADLGRDQAVRRTHAPVDLAAARRRRRVRGLLVAAAAIVVVGVAVDRADLGTDQLGGGASSADSGSDSGSGGGAADGVRPEAAASGRADHETDDGVEGPAAAPQEQGFWDRAPVRLTAAHFARGVAQTRRHDLAQGRENMSTYANGVDQRDFDSLLRGESACHTTGWGRGRFVPARYDGTLGALVFRRPEGQTQVAELFLCGSDAPARSITLAAP
jgi:hypothetical protein